MSNIPSLYVYIYKNIKKENQTGVIINRNILISRIKRVVHTAPRIVYKSIFDEMEEMRMIKKVNSDGYIILNNPHCERLLKKSNEYAFPIHP